MKKKDIPDCLKCGVCCISLQDQDCYADVTDKDFQKLTPREKKQVVDFDGIQILLSGRNGAIATKWRKVRQGLLKTYEVCACVFLVGSPLVKCRCRIYGRRPESCRIAVKPGDKTCKEVRRLWLTADIERIGGG